MTESSDDLVVSFATFDDGVTEAEVADEVSAGATAQDDGGFNSRSDFDEVMSVAGISDNTGDAAEILASTEGFELQDFPWVVGVVAKSGNNDTLVGLACGNVAVAGAWADVQIEGPFLPDCGAGVSRVACEVDRWWNFDVEQIEGGADFPEQNLDLWRDVDSSGRAFESKLD